MQFYIFPSRQLLENPQRSKLFSDFVETLEEGCKIVKQRQLYIYIYIYIFDGRDTKSYLFSFDTNTSS